VWQVAKFKWHGVSVDLIHQPRSSAHQAHNDAVTRWCNVWFSGRRHLKLAMRLVKLWASARAINSSFHNTLPSLAYTVMLLHVYEQQPELTDASHSESDPDTAAAAAASALLFRFFRAFDAWPEQQCIRTTDCVRHTDLDEQSEALVAAQRHAQHARDPESEGFGRTLFVQDPLDVDVNLGTQAPALPHTHSLTHSPVWLE